MLSRVLLSTRVQPGSSMGWPWKPTWSERATLTDVMFDGPWNLTTTLGNTLSWLAMTKRPNERASLIASATTSTLVPSYVTSDPPQRRRDVP